MKDANKNASRALCRRQRFTATSWVPGVRGIRDRCGAVQSPDLRPDSQSLVSEVHRAPARNREELHLGRRSPVGLFYPMLWRVSEASFSLPIFVQPMVDVPVPRS